MSLPPLCKSIETRVAKELALARSQEEKALILTSALYEYGHSVFKALDSISPAKGANATGYLQAQSAATELLTFLVLPFIASCAVYKQGVTVLNDLSEMCSDELLRRKLVIYTNQLKRRWHQADPSALPINPRAARALPIRKDSHLVEAGALILLLLAVGGYFFIHLDLTSLIFPGWNVKPKVLEYKQVEVARSENQVDPPPSSTGSDPQAPAPTGEYFSYKDAKGIIHLGNDPNQGSRQAPQSPQEVPTQAPQQLPLPVPQQVPQQVPQKRAEPVLPSAPVNLPPVVINVAASGLNEFESCRCKNGLATRGDLKQEVLQKCEQPFRRTSIRNCRDIWLYNFGPNEFMQGICFDENRVKKVLSLDRGF